MGNHAHLVKLVYFDEIRAEIRDVGHHEIRDVAIFPFSGMRQ